MHIHLSRLIGCSVIVAALMSCNGGSSSKTDSAVAMTANDTASLAPSIQTETVSYLADTLPAEGYIAYDANKKGKLPVVLVVHEWWGLTEYLKSRVRQLAALGYFAMAADMYGHGQIAADPKQAMFFAKTYYMNPGLAKTRLEAALAKAKTYPQADTSQVAAIGYCFGGFIVLNAAKQGSPLKGVVSFHGDLSGLPPIRNGVKAAVLVCQGGSDSFVPEAAQAKFKKQMDSANAPYTFKVYPGATHAFTNPGATEIGKQFNMPIAYNAAADSASWNDMKAFFGTIFK
jgi:dienelactone hydrolase